MCIGRSGSSSSAFCMYGSKPHHMCMYKGVELLYDNIHTLQ